MQEVIFIQQHLPNARIKSFSFDKPTVLNVLYDALDSIAFTAETADSVKGILVVAAKNFPQMKGTITVTPNLKNDETVVEILSRSGDGENAPWIPALFDEMSSLIKTTGLQTKTLPNKNN